MTMKKNTIQIAISVVAFVLLVLVMLIYNINVAKYTKARLLQEKQIEECENRLAIVKQAKNDTNQKSTENVTGIDFDRVSTDNVIAETFLEKIMTWNNYKDYKKIRDELINSYNVSEESDFMTIFMPEICNNEASGKDYNVIDLNGINLCYEKMKSYVTNISGDEYSYLAIVNWSSRNESGVEGHSKAVVLYTIDSDGTISNLDAYAQ